MTVVAAAEDKSDAEQLAAYSRENLSPQLSGVQFLARTGRATEEILRQVSKGGYDLLLLAEPRKPSSRADFNFRELMRRSPIPMLIVKGERPSIRQILFCTAGGEPGKRDIIFGGRLARRAGAATTLLYVEPVLPPTPTSVLQPSLTPRATIPSRPWIVSHLEEGALTLRNQGIHVQVKERKGIVVEEILKEIQEGDHDLVVVGRHLRGPALRFGGTDLTTEIFHRAECPVLVVTGDLSRFS